MVHTGISDFNWMKPQKKRKMTSVMGMTLKWEEDAAVRTTAERSLHQSAGAPYPFAAFGSGMATANARANELTASANKKHIRKKYQ